MFLESADSRCGGRHLVKGGFSLAELARVSDESGFHEARCPIDRRTLTCVLVNQSINLIYRSHSYMHCESVARLFTMDAARTDCSCERVILSEMAYINHVCSSELINFDFLHKLENL